MSSERFDLSSDPPGGASPMEQRRRYLGVHFACCQVYSRVYANREGTAYIGYCPRCSRRVRFTIGPGGSDRRFFTAQ